MIASIHRITKCSAPANSAEFTLPFLDLVSKFQNITRKEVSKLMCIYIYNRLYFASNRQCSIGRAMVDSIASENGHQSAIAVPRVFSDITDRYRRSTTSSTAMLFGELSSNVSFASEILIYANRRAANDAGRLLLQSQQLTACWAAEAAASTLPTSSAYRTVAHRRHIDQSRSSTHWLWEPARTSIIVVVLSTWFTHLTHEVRRVHSFVWFRRLLTSVYVNCC